MSDRVDAIVIGAGVVGLAVARALAMGGRETIVLESQNAIGTETSSRNSEVIHAGIYYPTGSLKALLCVEGRRKLYDYCRSRKVAFRQCGKLIVATANHEMQVLERLKATSEANGLTGDETLQWLSRDQARKLEPELDCVGALLSPSTGIIDSHGLMLAMQGDAEAHGASLAFHSKVSRITRLNDGFRVQVETADGPFTIDCGQLVNAAGLGAQQIASVTEGMESALVPRLYLVRGCYFTHAGKAPFQRLVYPVPEHAGLGVHTTIDLAGQMRFGPDTEYVDSLDYNVDPNRAKGFYAEVRKYWPNLKDGAIQPGYAGIRPKLQGPEDKVRDFVIQGPDVHMMSGLVNLFGIESPGLTSCLAIADRVVASLPA